MTDREKLVDLLWQCVDLDTPFGEIADYLLSNGVRLEPKQATSDENKRWIPVSERLPENDGFVLVYTINQIVGEAILIDRKEFYWAGSDDDAEPIAVTHWMPLPEPPKE